MSKKTAVLFVCLGNICRSPMAETVFNKILAVRKLSDDFEVDSAGLIDYHEGEKADARMRNHARMRGYNITHISKPVNNVDFERFDYIVGMDDQNIRALTSRAVTEQQRQKICKMSDFCSLYKVNAVPDPYYGDDSGFIHVIDLLEDACEGFLQFIRN
ncbi:MAG: protein tyrosine phosphatase [Bacteroidetes bacterium]|nr:protein tyrosine phosphatase [Bacteroidota bacterium]